MVIWHCGTRRSHRQQLPASSWAHGPLTRHNLLLRELRTQAAPQRPAGPQIPRQWPELLRSRYPHAPTRRSSPRRRGAAERRLPPRPVALPGWRRALPGRGDKAEVLWGRCRRRAQGCSPMVCGGCRPQARSLQAQYGDGGGGGSWTGETARSDSAQFLHLQPQTGAQGGRGTGGGGCAPRLWGEEGSFPTRLCPGLGCRRGPYGGCHGYAVPLRGLGRSLYPRY